MINSVIISQRSHALFPLIKNILLSREERDLVDNRSLLAWLSQVESQTEINTPDLVAWLSKTITLDEESQFLLESLRAALLQDLFNSIPAATELSDSVNSQSNEAIFRFLTIAGTIVAICEGFDGVASIIGLFPAVPQVVMFMAGVVFAALSVIVFCGFDLVAISNNLGVDIEKTHRLIDVYLEQVEQINKLREAISICCTQEDAEGQNILLQISRMLATRYAALDAAREGYQANLSAPYLTTAKLVTSAVAGVLFFGGGFFSGQSLALAAASLFLPSVSSVFWPIMVVSFVVGLAAFSIYWFVERPGLESLVSRWLGMDEDKINAFVDDRVVNRQKRELGQLIKQVNQVQQLHHQLERLVVFDNVANQAPPPPTVLVDRTTFFRQRSRSASTLGQAATKPPFVQDEPSFGCG